MSRDHCDVCGALGRTIIACSSLGGYSFAYCERCLSAQAEPYGFLVTEIAMANGVHNVAEWVEDIIKGTLSVTGRTITQLNADVQKSIDILWADNR